MADKPTEVTFGKDPIKGALDAIERQLPEIMRMQEIVAQIRRRYYECLLEQGFTKDQALELAKVHSLVK